MTRIYPDTIKVRRLKTIAAIMPSGVDKHTIEGEVPVRLCNYVDVYKNDRITNQLSFMEASATPAEMDRFALQAGDVVITKDSETPADIAVAALVEESAAGVVCGYHLALLRPCREVVNSTFLFWALKSPEALAQFTARAQGITRFGLTTNAMGDVLLPVPPLGYQSVVASFLDRETAKIDALVAEQERLIALLREKRQAVISRAVTKGLDPTVPTKDSGVEWLERIPTGWTALQLGRLCTQVSDGPHYSPAYVDDGVLFLSARNIRVDGWSLDDAKYVSEADYEEFCRRVIPQKGDILYTKGGTTGIARVVDLAERFRVWVHVAVLKIDMNKALPHFVAYALNSVGCYEQSQLHTRGATNNDLGLTRMVKIWLALPPMNEQAEVARYLDHETHKIDMLIADIERAIGLLKERRAALISAAVTGKIDVRGLVPSLQAAA